MKVSSTDLIGIDETKLESTFFGSQFEINDYQLPPYRRDREKHERHMILSIKEGLITNRLDGFKAMSFEFICMNFTISNKKWFAMLAYNPPAKKKTKYFLRKNKCICSIL